MSPDRSTVTGAVQLLLGWLVITGLTLAAGWLVTSAVWAGVEPAEDEAVRWFAEGRTPPLDPVVEVVAYAGDTLVEIVAAPLVAVMVWVLTRSRAGPLFVVLVSAGESAIYFLTTALVSRARPPVEILDPGLVPDHSYPSGHVGTATALWVGGVVLVRTYAHADSAARRWVLLLLVLPVVVLVCRLYQGAHHPSDVLAGLLYAAAWVALVARVVLPGPAPGAPSAV